MRMTCSFSTTRCRGVDWGSRMFIRVLVGVVLFFSSFPLARQAVVGFFRIRVNSLGSTYGSSGSFEIAWIHSGAASGRQVHPGSRRFTRAHLGVVLLRSSSFFGFSCVHSGEPSGLWSHWGWRGFTRARLAVVGFIRVHVCSLGRA